MNYLNEFIKRVFSPKRESVQLIICPLWVRKVLKYHRRNLARFWFPVDYQIWIGLFACLERTTNQVGGWDTAASNPLKQRPTLTYIHNHIFMHGWYFCACGCVDSQWAAGVFFRIEKIKKTLSCCVIVILSPHSSANMSHPDSFLINLNKKFH